MKRPVSGRRRLLGALLLGGTYLLLASCGTGSPAARPTPTPTPTPSRLIAVLQTDPNQDWRAEPSRVAIVDLTGSVKASADFQPRLKPYIGNAAVPLQSPAQVVGDAVYYIDGFGTVKALRPAGKPKIVASFSVQPAQYETWFAVSPSGSSVVAGILQFPAIGSAPTSCAGLECMPPLVGSWRFSLARVDEGNAAALLQQRESMTSPDSQAGGWHPEFPIAWLPDGPVIMRPLYIGTQNAWFGGFLYQIDTAGADIRQLSGADCLAASIVSGKFVACTSSADNSISVRDLSGKLLWTPHLDGLNALVLGLSPNGDGVFSDYQLETRTLGKVALPQAFFLEGWLDNSTIIGRPIIGNGPDKGDLSWISLGDPGTVHDIGIKADFVGTIR